jgi:hypothetical protein
LLLRSKIRPTPCPGRSKIVSADGLLGSFLIAFYPPPGPCNKLGPLLSGPSSLVLEKMNTSISGVPLGVPTYFTVVAVGKISIFIIKIELFKNHTYLLKG